MAFYYGIVGVISSILFGSTINLASVVMLEPFFIVPE